MECTYYFLSTRVHQDGGCSPLMFADPHIQSSPDYVSWILAVGDLFLRILTSSNDSSFGLDNLNSIIMYYCYICRKIIRQWGGCGVMMMCVFSSYGKREIFCLFYSQISPLSFTLYIESSMVMDMNFELLTSADHMQISLGWFGYALCYICIPSYR